MHIWRPPFDRPPPSGDSEDHFRRPEDVRGPPPADHPDPDSLDGELDSLEGSRPGPARDDDFSINDEPPAVYKAPSGVPAQDEQPGVGPYAPLKAQGGDSNFFAYFLTAVVLCIIFYLMFHNKQKILALIIEGRSPSGRRRPHSSQYRKLDNSLEEVISSQQRQEISSNIIY
ncbi:trans-Golgi network integral membrane protein 1-like [Pollicipes pollicipes]|uniref:trans-Golgi network integral membrane protein 1-like n=1 Tax=Pollicipes pollicipes TaxID=41117 RepID=UPI0018857C7F|nr:trans-Golgi network integral membrane protein 1-like [Pollicipes pollicipes]